MVSYLDFTYVKRFLRTVIPQLIVVMPVLIARGAEFDKYLPFWVIPALILLGGIFTALDKFFRNIGFYQEVKDLVVKN